MAKRNPNIAIIFSFLHKLKDILISYFNELEEESIRDNFVLIYELMDEIMDHGYPQITDSKILKEFIKTTENRITKQSKNKDARPVNPNEVRNPNKVYKVNKAYLDVVEEVNSLIAANGTMIRSEIIGHINMKTELSGMPNLKLGLNDKVFFEVSGKSTKSRTIEMDHLQFHNCVDMNKFGTERTIEFIPPDGSFELMSYRLNTQLKPLIMVEVNIESQSSTKIEYNIKAKSNYRSRSVAHNVEIQIPVPNDLKNPIFKTMVGNVNYLPDQDSIVWIINDLKGQTEIHLKLHFNVPTIRINNADKHLKKPIAVKFDIPSFTVSGIQVRYLKIQEKSGYQAFPYVKYVTKNGEFQIRMV